MASVNRRLDAAGRALQPPPRWPGVHVHITNQVERGLGLGAVGERIEELAAVPAVFTRLNRFTFVTARTRRLSRATLA
jgi:hypothetical protein